MIRANLLKGIGSILRILQTHTDLFISNTLAMRQEIDLFREPMVANWKFPSKALSQGSFSIFFVHLAGERHSLLFAVVLGKFAGRVHLQRLELYLNLILNLFIKNAKIKLMLYFCMQMKEIDKILQIWLKTDSLEKALAFTEGISCRKD